MKKQQFSAQELYCIAYLAGKKKMYGISIVFGDKRNKKIQDVIDDLVKQQIAEMDIDGKARLNEAYKPIADIISGCDKCITINVQHESGAANDYVFWRCSSDYFMAEVLDHRYVISQISAEFISSIFDGLTLTSQNEGQTRQCIVPQLVLAKAKRLCISGQQDDAVRLLRQNGASEETAEVITKWLCERAHYVGILLMEIQNSVCQKRGNVFLSANGMSLALSQSVENYRTCITFNEIARDDVNKTIRQAADAFLYE